MDDHFKKHGVFSWNELMTTDLAEAREFYEKLLKWEYEESDLPEGGTYVVAKVDGKMVGGMFTKPSNLPVQIPPHWGAYVTVDNVDKAVEQVDELGGNVLLQPTEIPGVGRFAVIQDPQGAVLSIITYPKE